MATINTALIAGSIFVTWRIITCLLPERLAFLAWSGVVALFYLGLNATTVSLTYFFSAGLQPSTIATFCVLLGALYYLQARELASGMVLTVGAVFHLNYAVVAIAAFGLAHVALGRERLLPRLLRQHTGMLLVLLANLPIVLALGAGVSAQESKAATDVFLHVAVPGHYDPLSYLPLFLPFAAWQVFALAERECLPEGVARTRLTALYVAMLVIITAALLLTTVVVIPAVARAFFFRLNPFALLFACIVIAVAAAQRLDGAGVAAARVPGVLLRLAAVYMIGFSAWLDPTIGTLQAAIVSLLAGGAGLLSIPRLRPALLVRHAMPLGAATVLLAAGAAFDPAHFNLLLGPPDSHTAALFRWVRSTPRDSLFLTPPDMVTFRLATGRAIIVDRKAVPMDTRSILAWYRRMEDVSGRPGFRTLEAADQGYAQMNAARLDRLVRSFQPDYAILPNHAGIAQAGREVAYADAWFVVLRCRPQGREH
jgi:hypothetical protein